MHPPFSYPPPQACFHPDPLHTLAPHLFAHLPRSLPLLRRIQHHTSSSPSARVYASFAADTCPPPNEIYSAVFVDRSRRPETEAWIWSSFESLGSEDGQAGDGVDDQLERGEVKKKRLQKDLTAAKEEDGFKSEQRRLHIRAQLLVLLHAAVQASSSALAPRLPSQLPASNDMPPTELPPVLILGTLNELLIPLLAGRDLDHLRSEPILSRDPIPIQEDDSSPLPPATALDGRTMEASDATIKAQKNVLTGITNPYRKWLLGGYPTILPPSSSPPPNPSLTTNIDTNTTTKACATLPHLPPSYIYSAPLPTDLPTVVSRTAIPRTVQTLRHLGAVGVRYRPATTNTTDDDDNHSGELISWCFISPDGSLASLHVEASHRGKGIAKAVTWRVMQKLSEKGGTDVGFRDLDLDSKDISSEVLDAAATTAITSTNHLSTENNFKGEQVAAEPRLANKAAASASAHPEHLFRSCTAHSDVAEGNLESEGVMKAVGGRIGWGVRWVGVDVRRLKGVVEEMEMEMRFEMRCI